MTLNELAASITALSP